MGAPLETQVLTGPEAIRKAADLLLEGEIVGVPTETVYGLAANALDPEAVAKIFAAKGRPQDNPLIVHIADSAMLDFVGRDVPDSARKLAARFWPGPLSLIVRKSSAVPDCVSAGLDTVAVRMPAHTDIRQIIRMAGVPLAAPSANISGLPSPTRAAHVLRDMDGRIPLIVDGGDCDVGVESTVVDLTQEIPVILRPGAITQPDLEEVLGEVAVAAAHADPGQSPRSPGMKYRHYAPKARVEVFEGDENKVAKSIRSLYDTHKEKGGKPLVLCAQSSAPLYEDLVVHTLGDDRSGAQHAVFGKLREADDMGADLILFHYEEQMGEAVKNRISRAALAGNADACLGPAK